MSFSGNFTRVSLGANPAGESALFVEGRTDNTAEPPRSIHVILPHNGEPLTATVDRPDVTDWEVMFPDGDPPFAAGATVFVVGVAMREEPHDPFVWEGSFTLEAKEEP
jgi:hypothetical protein